MLIGIDIGGTNTDAVLVDAHKKIIGAVKVPTTSPLEIGFENALDKLYQKQGGAFSDVKALLIGSTHATNAILEGKDLYKVGVLRIAGHHPTTLPPCFSWPKPLQKAVLANIIHVDGGFECDGRPLTPLNLEQIKYSLLKLIDEGAESLAIVGVFSPLYPQQEEIVARLMEKVAPQIPYSLSHQLGGIGWMERENGTILNAALKKVMKNGFENLLSKARKFVNCPLYVTQNNGSLITLEEAIASPILTLSAGPTNSFVGGAKLAERHDAIIVDVGGTSTDVGMVQNGFPRRCMHASNIGGVTLSYALPDVLSIALGGGSHIHLDQNTIGPKSAAKNLLKEAVSLGGNQLTLTDIAIVLEKLSLPGSDKKRVKIEKSKALEIMQYAFQEIKILVEKMEANRCDLPVILVGGGAELFPQEHLSHRFLIPEHFSVANAYGAALAEIAATIDTTISLTTRDEKLEEIKGQALEKAKAKGACNKSTRIVDIQVMPYHYMPGHLARVIVTAAGPMHH